MACGLESFKAEVVRRVKIKPERPVRDIESRFVFINADKEDTPLASLLKAEFDKNALSAAITSFDGDAEAVRRDLEESMVDCSALLFVYGKSSPIWVRGQLRLYNKLKARRTDPPRAVALYIGPPSDKPDLGFSVPGEKQLDCRSGIAVEPLRDLIAELTG
jgi:hypothetical protein